jgi:hypothetical protein
MCLTCCPDYCRLHAYNCNKDEHAVLNLLMLNDFVGFVLVLYVLRSLKKKKISFIFSQKEM